MPRSFAPPVATLALGLLFGPALALDAQAVVSALVSDSEPLESTTDVLLSRFADFSAAPGLAVGTELAAGDMLSSVSGRTDVELTCGEETVLRFAGGFRVLIDAPQTADCALDFLSGTLDVLTDRPTEVDTGLVTLGSEGTQYTVELTREGDDADRRVVVFDGRVRVRADDVDELVATGATWRLQRGAATWGRVDEADLERTAGRYARFDTARQVAVMPRADRELVAEQFRALHHAVLSRPDDSGKRADLAREQLKARQTPQALYHLKRGDLTTEEKLASHRIDRSVAEMMRRPLTSTRELYVVPVYPPTGSPPDPFSLIEQRRYEEAIESLLERAREGASSRVYYGLAQAYLGLQGIASRRAQAYASRALDLQAVDRELSPEEVSHCRRIRDARSP